MQRTLFDMVKKKQEPVQQKEEKKVEAAPQISSYLPKEGDRVIILNLNEGIEGIVEYVDYPNLFNDYFHPIQCNVEKLNNLMFRTNLKNIRPA